MALGLEGPVRIGTVQVAAVVEQRVEASARTELGAIGVRRPVAVLIRTGDRIAAFSCDGSTIAPADFDERFAGIWARFEGLTR